jgi:pimeloyl-ACP methyl ester carboxylesterase
MMILAGLLVAVLLVVAALALHTHRVARQVSAALPPQGRWLDIDGHRVHCIDKGQGPAIVFVHGLSGQVRNFDYLPLDDLARSHRVVLIDRPGSGHSVRSPGADAGVAAQAAIVASVIQRLGLDRPLLVGHSLGGAIALAVGLDHPASVRGLALIAPLTHFQPKVPEPFKGLAVRPAALRRLLAWTLAVPVAMATKDAVLAFIFGPERMPADFPVRGGGLLGLRPQSYLGAAEDLEGVEQDLPALQARYGELRLPVAILYGRGDRVLDWQEQGEALVRAVPHARLTVVDGGHMLPVTQPGLTMQWLAPLAAAPAPEVSALLSS